MSSKIVIDPITRIEGHLRVETEVANGMVINAWSTGTLFRGVEPILKNRDPRDAWMITQRVCGVCTYIHGITSIRAVENSIDPYLVVPENARIIRNLLGGAQFVHDHIVHFYALHLLDWVDVTRAIAATDMDAVVAADQAISSSRTRDASYFADVKQRLLDVATSNQLGPLANGYWGHSAYTNLSPEVSLIMMADYLEALRIQARIIKVHALLGGKNPHPQSMLIGGVSLDLVLDETQWLALYSELNNLSYEAKTFVDTYYLPDVAAIASAYPEYRAIGGTDNLLCFGGVADLSSSGDLMFPRGAIINRATGSVQAVNEAEITEHVARSWYAGSTPQNPASGATNPTYTGLDLNDKYSWLKAPRYNGQPMEVGPLARVMVAYGLGTVPAITQLVGDFLANTGMTLADMYSTMGRTAARAIETKFIADSMYADWVNELMNRINPQLTTDTVGRVSFTMPPQPTCNGSFLNEAPRGALGHWVSYSSNGGNPQITNYQMVVPSTWNFGPRDANDVAGPVEQALVGTPVVNQQQPLEVLRTVHSFDPCIACAVH
jgi:Ni,Fe-hydrogenase I large subunit